MRILVTGATGVVGRRAVPALIAAGHDVVAAGRNPERLAALARAGARTVTIDLLNAADVNAAMRGRDTLINLATHIPSSSVRMMLPWSWRENDRIRRDATRLLGQAAANAGVGRWIQESFAPVYEDGGAEWISEDAPVRPAPYNRTTLDAEQAVARYSATGGTGVVMRFAGFYGPDSALVRSVMDSVRRGVFPMPGAPDAYWSSVSHDDAASAVLAALAAPAGIYNVGDDEPLTRRALADAYAAAIGSAPPRLLPAWTVRLMGASGELLARSQRMSNATLRALGWAPQHRSAREGLAAIGTALRPRPVRP